MSYSILSNSITSLKNMAGSRGINHATMVHKESVITAILTHDLGLVETSSFTMLPQPLLKESVAAMKKLIHDRLAGGAIPAMIEVLRNVQSLVRRGVLIAVLMYLDSHGIHESYNSMQPNMASTRKNGNILRDILTLTSIGQCTAIARGGDDRPELHPSRI